MEMTVDLLMHLWTSYQIRFGLASAVSVERGFVVSIYGEGLAVSDLYHCIAAGVRRFLVLYYQLGWSACAI